MYNPTSALLITSIPPTPWRIGIQGSPGTGKTWSALTFPNPIVMDLDNKLNAHSTNPNIYIVPIWNQEWRNKFVPPRNPSKPTSKHFATKKWLEQEAQKLSREQTLILDSWTMLQNAFDAETEPIFNKAHEEDTWAFWKLKLNYAIEITDLFKSLTCNLVCICHEIQEKNKSGFLTGRIKPLMQGQFGEQLQGHFTDFFRMLMRREENASLYSYQWQLRSDNIVGCTTSFVIPDGVTVIPADYQSLLNVSKRPQ